jgi:regulator of sigma E protease
LNFLTDLLHYTEGIVVFLIILVVLVAAHEYGHYLFARMFKMGVEEFAIGMLGKQPLVTWRRRTYRLKVLPGEDPNKRSSGFALEGGSTVLAPSVVLDGPNGKELEETTVFTIRPWPIGGYVRIKGMMPEEDGSEVHIPGGFYSKPPWQRFVVLLAGPVFSILSGMIVMIPILTFVGHPTSSNEPKIGTEIAGGPAEKAGIKTGDVIVSINGKRVSTFYDIISMVRDSPNKPLEFVYRRGSQLLSGTVVPQMEVAPQPVLGPNLEMTGEFRRQALMGVERTEIMHREPLGESIASVLAIPGDNLRAIASIFREFDTVKETVSGPVGMVRMTTDEVQDGFVSVVALAATISIALGFANLLPVYPMDGGQMIVALAEMFRRGRRLSLRVQTVISTVGFSMLALLAMGALGVDVINWADSGKEPKSPFVTGPDKSPPPAHAPPGTLKAK